MCSNLASELGAHVSRLWLRADASEIKPVSIPASANGRFVAQTTMSVPSASVMEKLEMLIADVEQYSAKTLGVGRSSRPVCVIPAVMISTGIVENGEQADNVFDCAASTSDKQTITFDTTPV